MKLHLSHAPGLNLISAYGDGYVQIRDQRHQASLIVLPERILPDWPVSEFGLLTPAHFSQLAELQPELVLLGTGTRHRFPHPSLYQALIAAGISLEHMDTGAACRTYNILAAEGRKVAAALIVGS
ncbi:MAG: Mth938-like domain-containing protein [Parasulfuritortus sp.]|nr:Mth938-like domain-containing protein [Parasulfuritortus sp.]